MRKAMKDHTVQLLRGQYCIILLFEEKKVTMGGLDSGILILSLSEVIPNP